MRFIENTEDITCAASTGCMVSSLILPAETVLPQLDYDESEDEASYEIPDFTLNKACTGLEIKLEITKKTAGIKVE